MISKELQFLKELAKNATPGLWHYDCGNGQVETKKHRILICNRVGNLERINDLNSMYSGESDFKSEILKIVKKHDNETDLEFIAAANPEVILELIEYIERLSEYFEYLGDLSSKCGCSGCPFHLELSSVIQAV